MRPLLVTFIFIFSNVSAQQLLWGTPFNDLSGWTIEADGPGTNTPYVITGNACQYMRESCLYLTGGDIISRTVDTTGFHSIEIEIDVQSIDQESGEWCYLQYETQSVPASTVNVNILNTVSRTFRWDYTVFVQDTSDYNDQPSFTLRLGNSGDAGGDLCAWDDLKVYGIPYPTISPTPQPSNRPSSDPSASPTLRPTEGPTKQPSSQPSSSPTDVPSSSPSANPSDAPSSSPTLQPSQTPSVSPSAITAAPSVSPTANPSHVPSVQSTNPSISPTAFPSNSPTDPTTFPSDAPSMETSELVDSEDSPLQSQPAENLTVWIIVGSVFMCLPITIIFVCCCMYIKHVQHKKAPANHGKKIQFEMQPSIDRVASVESFRKVKSISNASSGSRSGLKDYEEKAYVLDLEVVEEAVNMVEIHGIGQEDDDDFEVVADDEDEYVAKPTNDRKADIDDHETLEEGDVVVMNAANLANEGDNVLREERRKSNISLQHASVNDESSMEDAQLEINTNNFIM